MKIGIVLDDTLDSSDGVQQYVKTLSKWLEKSGHDVHFLVTDTQPAENIHSFGKRIKLRFNRNNVAIPLPVSAKKIQRILVRNNYDVLHVQMPYSPMFASRLLSLAPKNTAIVGTFHIAPYSKGVKHANDALGLLIKPSLKLFDEVIAVSEAASRLAKRSYRLNPLIIPNAVDVGSMKISQTKNEQEYLISIVFLGRLVKRKGCKNFILALSKLMDLGIKFDAKIVGGGTDRKKLERLARKHNLNQVVTFTGKVSEDRKKLLLSQADFAVFPSLGGESFGIVIIEAMAAQSRVVLAGDIPGYNEVLADTPEALFDSRNPAEIAATIKKFLDNDSLAKTVHIKQQRSLSKYDIKTVGPQIEEVYKLAIAKNDSSRDNNK